MNRRFVDIEGTVMRVGEKSLWFREEQMSHDICIPLSQIEDAHAVSEGQEGLRVSTWMLSRLEDEGKR